MPDYRITFFFEGVQERPAGFPSGRSATIGWTETWYLTTPGNLDTALAFAQDDRNYGNLRRAFLPNLYIMTWVRASDEANPRSSKVAEINLRGRVAEVAHGDDPISVAAQVQCAVLVNFTVLPSGPNEPAHHRRFLIRGLPQDLINGNVLRPSSPFMRRLVAFLNFMGRGQVPVAPAAQRGPWSIRFYDPAVRFQPITNLSIAEATQGRQINVIANLPALAPGKTVRIKRVTIPRGANRIWTVRNDAPANGPYQLVRSRFELTGSWSNDGQIRANVFKYQPPDQYLLIGLRNKKTGSIFPLLRGKRRGA